MGSTTSRINKILRWLMTFFLILVAIFFGLAVSLNFLDFIKYLEQIKNIFSNNLLLLNILIYLSFLISFIFITFFTANFLKRKRKIAVRNVAIVSFCLSVILVLISNPPKFLVILLTPTLKLEKENKKIAFIKDKEVVIKFLDTGEEVKTSIPIRWQDPKATWCGGFDWTSDGKKIVAFLDNYVTLFDLESRKNIELKNFHSKEEIKSDPSLYSRFPFFSKKNMNGTWLYSLEDFSVRQISEKPLLSDNQFLLLSPDGKKILMSRLSGEKDKWGNPLSNYFILNLENQEEVKITFPSNASVVSPSIYGFFWLPNSYEITYYYETNFNDDKERFFKSYSQIGVYNLETKSSIDLNLPFSDVGNPIYSPNGKYLIFENRDAPQELWIANKDGSNPKKLADKAVDFYELSWSSDSDFIVYGNVGKGIFIVDRDGNNRMTVSEEGFCPIISPQ